MQVRFGGITPLAFNNSHLSTRRLFDLMEGLTAAAARKTGRHAGVLLLPEVLLNDSFERAMADLSREAERGKPPETAAFLLTEDEFEWMDLRMDGSRPVESAFTIYHSVVKPYLDSHPSVKPVKVPDGLLYDSETEKVVPYTQVNPNAETDMDVRLIASRGPAVMLLSSGQVTVVPISWN